MQISDDTKNRIIDLFVNSHMRINTILKKVAPNGELLLEDIYIVLDEYRENNPGKCTRKERIITVDRISDDELFKLKEQGLTYKEIVEYFNAKGIKTNYATINSRCKKIYNDLGIERCDLRKGNRVKISDEEIFALREQGFSYKKITEYFKANGLNVSKTTVEKRCKGIYDKLGKEEPDLRKVDIPNDEIIQLRKKGFSFEKIAEYFNIKGINVTSPTIGIKYRINDYKIGNVKADMRKGPKFNDTIDDEIFMLRLGNASYRDIEYHLKAKNISISHETIRKRIQKLESDAMKLKQDDKVAYKNKIKKAILNLRQSKHASYRQIKLLAEMYGVDLELDNEKEHER